MKKPHKNISIVILIVSFFSCTHYSEERQEVVAEKLQGIVNNQQEWDALNNRVLGDGFININLGKIIRPSDLNESLATELIKKGIVDFVVYKTDSCRDAQYFTNWTEHPIGAFYLNCYSCDSVRTKRGYYMDNWSQNFIETWGVGNNWSILMESDFM